jgi:hypothetical protein
MLLRHHGLMEDLRFRYLAAKCLAEVQEWDELLMLLGDEALDDDMEEEVRLPEPSQHIVARHIPANTLH